MSRLAGGTGHHRQHRRDPFRPRTPPPEPVRILAEAASGDLTVDELRAFLDEVEEAAGAGLAGHLRPQAAVRLSGAVKGIWVRIPVRE